MSDDEKDDDDLFADSDDTAELIAASNANRKQPAAKAAPAAKKKTTPAPAPKRKKDDKPDADNDSDDDDDDKGLFDSDSDDDEDLTSKKKKSKQISAKKPSTNTAMSKRERLEALANRHRKDDDDDDDDRDKKSKKRQASSSDKPKKDDAKKADDKGYDSGDSYDSREFQRTKEDDDFIDTTGEDADAVNELYAEQNFDDERPDGDDDRPKKKKKRQVRYDSDDPDNVGRNADLEPDNPIMAAVHRMKKKKTVKKGLNEMEDEIKTFLGRMEMAAEEDEQLIAEKKPATKKLSMLNEVCDMLTKRDMQRMLLDFDLLSVCKRWVQPLPNGTLGNVTVRQRLMEVIGNMTGETGITASDLKRSEFGKVVMILFKHRSETPNMKRQLKVLIEQWSRPIFQKSGNMRDLDRVSRGESGLAALSRQNYIAEQIATSSKKGNTIVASGAAAASGDLSALIAGNTGGNKKLEAGVNRVRVPYSKGFAFQVRPTDRVDGPTGKQRGGGGGRGSGGGAGAGAGGAATADTRNKLIKRMTEKGKAVSKNQRSANISVEGRVTKG